jgi:hypothetical protein
MRNLIEKIVVEEIRSEVRGAVKQYFASFVELQKGPVFQVHAAMTRNGLTKAVRKTKRSQLADMEVGKEYFFKTPKNVDVRTWTNRWAKSAYSMQVKTGYRWSTHRDHEQGGAVIVRTR